MTPQEKHDMKFLHEIKELGELNGSNFIFIKGYDSLSNLFARTTNDIRSIMKYLQSGESTIFKYKLVEEWGEVEKHCIALKDDTYKWEQGKSTNLPPITTL